LIKQVKKLLQ